MATADSGAWAALRWAIGRDLLLAARSPAAAVLAIGFFLLAAAIFPLGVGPEPEQLKRIAPGVIWACAALAMLSPLTRLYEPDYAAGVLEQLALSGRPLAALVAGKAVAHWLAIGVPITIAAPLTGLWFGLDTDAVLVLMASLAPGLATLTLLGGLCAALTLGADAGRGGGTPLIALLLLPLAVPVLILGAGAVDATANGLSPAPHLALLTAFLLVSLVVSPVATAAAVKIALE